MLQLVLQLSYTPHTCTRARTHMQAHTHTWGGGIKAEVETEYRKQHVAESRSIALPLGISEVELLVRHR